MDVVKFIDLTPTVALVEEQSYETWREVLSSKGFIHGKHTAEVERKLAERLGARHAICCANGTDALVLGLMAAGIGKDDWVAVPNLTFWASAEAPAILGCNVVLIDVGTDLHLDAAAFKAACDAHPIKACVLPNLFGWAATALADMRAFCTARGIALIEDDAQAFGVESGGESIFKGAQVSTLSFYPAKVIGGCMDGGAVLTNDDDLAKRIRSIANHGRAEHYSYAHVGMNSRMAELNAAFLTRLLDHADTLLDGRREAFAAYRARLSDVPGLTFHAVPDGQTGNGYLTMLTHERLTGDEMVAKLKERGIFCGRVYPETMDMQPPAAGWTRFGSLERSRFLCRHLFSLPLYYGIAPEAVQHVCDTLIDLLATEARA
ncbi:DegT/DnrJ/EryC1/StrS family aminotransferase [Novispirillum sp. DQ9]|uniref:DegT/DnrJ/EryC1/StrS family aminotransferase n=1 Tax=Novispirillum sp. DQ9 TaxID=3398612 RepID=UPI003C7BF96A